MTTLLLRPGSTTSTSWLSYTFTQPPWLSRRSPCWNSARHWSWLIARCRSRWSACAVKCSGRAGAGPRHLPLGTSAATHTPPGPAASCLRGGAFFKARLGGHARESGGARGGAGRRCRNRDHRRSAATATDVTLHRVRGKARRARRWGSARPAAAGRQRLGACAAGTGSDLITLYRPAQSTAWRPRSRRSGRPRRGAIAGLNSRLTFLFRIILIVRFFWHEQHLPFRWHQRLGTHDAAAWSRLRISLAVWRQMLVKSGGGGAARGGLRGGKPSVRNEHTSPTE